MELSVQEGFLKPEAVPISVIIPTYNEADNIEKLLDEVVRVVSDQRAAEIVVVDDNSPDHTADKVDEYSRRNSLGSVTIKVIRRPAKLGLSSALLAGILGSTGDVVVVMDSDFSHPPQTIPTMVDALKDQGYDIVVASRYVKGGSISNWPFRRKLMSKGATKIAKYGLRVGIKDPMSGFFAFRRRIISNLKFEPMGYKMLLEMIVKAREARIKEIPYSFVNRQLGKSKVDLKVMTDYVRSVWHLYRYGKASKESRISVRFLSKAARFYTVGALGLLINYAVSTIFRHQYPDSGVIYATSAGIVFSIVSNFFLNKLWTFGDREFSPRKFASQLGLFFGFSSVGALVQLGLVYLFTQVYHQGYEGSLVAAVAIASVSNFLFNKKWTFQEKVWS